MIDRDIIYKPKRISFTRYCEVNMSFQNQKAPCSVTQHDYMLHNMLHDMTSDTAFYVDLF